MSRNADTHGISISLAISDPAEEYGCTTRSAPARSIFVAASSVEARATIWMSGRAARAETAM